MVLSYLPEGKLILSGLEDLNNGNSNTVGAWLIAIASTRLTEAGLEFPQEHLAAEPELALYTYLEGERDDAYPYYNALLNGLSSVCNALELNNGGALSTLRSWQFSDQSRGSKAFTGYFG